jgi:ferritin
MIQKKMEKAINEQINAETYSAYLYMSMSAHFKSANLDGFANWFSVQCYEELFHAKKFYDYLLERGGKVTLLPIQGPPTEWSSPEKAFEDAYRHEQLVTGRINDLVNLAIEEKDHATNAMLQWFVGEQVEEEANASGILEKIKLAGNQGSGLFLLDRELALRTFNAQEYQGQE